jgi:hypothetical protein
MAYTCTPQTLAHSGLLCGDGRRAGRGSGVARERYRLAHLYARLIGLDYTLGLRTTRSPRHHSSLTVASAGGQSGAVVVGSRGWNVIAVRPDSGGGGCTIRTCSRALVKVTPMRSACGHWRTSTQGSTCAQVVRVSSA